MADHSRADQAARQAATIIMASDSEAASRDESAATSRDISRSPSRTATPPPSAA